jgi:general L-amino acid transport system substrate-binding protein
MEDGKCFETNGSSCSVLFCGQSAGRCDGDFRARGWHDQLGPITQRIIDRGELICGVNAAVPGFGVVNAAVSTWASTWTLPRRGGRHPGDANAVSFRPLTGGTVRRPTRARSRHDLRNTTYTLSRDVTWAVIFAPTTFYDGQGVMVKADLG